MSGEYFMWLKTSLWLKTFFTKWEEMKFEDCVETHVKRLYVPYPAF